MRIKSKHLLNSSIFFCLFIYQLQMVTAKLLQRSRASSFSIPIPYQYCSPLPAPMLSMLSMLNLWILCPKYTESLIKFPVCTQSSHGLEVMFLRYRTVTKSTVLMYHTFSSIVCCWPMLLDSSPSFSGDVSSGWCLLLCSMYVDMKL